MLSKIIRLSSFISLHRYNYLCCFNFFYLFHNSSSSTNSRLLLLWMMMFIILLIHRFDISCYCRLLLPPMNLSFFILYISVSPLPPFVLFFYCSPSACYCYYYDYYYFVVDVLLLSSPLVVVAVVVHLPLLLCKSLLQYYITPWVALYLLPPMCFFLRNPSHRRRFFRVALVYSSSLVATPE